MRRRILLTVFLVTWAGAQDVDYYFLTKVKDAQDSTLAYFKFADDRIKIEGRGGVFLKARNPQETHCVYEDLGDSTWLQVKTNRWGFKVLDPTGRLRWKVRFAEDKIKISDNETNSDPCELKLKATRTQVVFRGADLGSVKFYEDKVKVKDGQGRTLYATSNPYRTASYGLLLCGHIPARERYILMAEILRSNR